MCIIGYIHNLNYTFVMLKPYLKKNKHVFLIIQLFSKLVYNTGKILWKINRYLCDLDLHLIL